MFKLVRFLIGFVLFFVGMALFLEGMERMRSDSGSEFSIDLPPSLRGG